MSGEDAYNTAFHEATANYDYLAQARVKGLWREYLKVGGYPSESYSTIKYYKFSVYSRNLSRAARRRSAVLSTSSSGW